MTFRQIQSGTSHQQEPLVFLPGWGFDGRVAHYWAWLPALEVLAPASFCHAGLVAELKEYLAKEKIARVALVGWSMGANLAWQFATTYPEMVSSVTLLGGRGHWPAPEIAAIKVALAADLPKSMRDFYRKCFLGHKGLYLDFAGGLQDDYLARLSRQDLEDGLDYLASSPLVGQAPEGCVVRVVHGRKDIIAPFEERPRIGGGQEQVVDAAGHLLFSHSPSSLLR